MASYPDSYYAATANASGPWPQLKGEKRADVCVIGAGFTGISAALHLSERGYKVIVLEAQKIGWGASGRNGGQIYGSQRKDQEELEAKFGKEKARQLWDLGVESGELVKDLIAKHGIDCDLKPGILMACHKSDYVDWFRTYADKMAREYDYPHYQVLNKAEVEERLGTRIYYGGVVNEKYGHFHPLNFVLGLAKAATEAGAEIYEDSAVLSYDSAQPTTIKTAKGSVRADHVVLACNGYIERLEPRVIGKIMPINNFILTTEPLSEEQARSLIRDDTGVSDTKFVVNYFRLTADRRLLFGGGENYRRGFPPDLKTFVRKHMMKVFPQMSDARIDYAWGGTLAVTMSRAPHFGRLAPNIFFAQGYSGQGVAGATFGGKLIAEAVAGTAERFDIMADLKIRPFPGGTLLRWPGMVAGMLYYAMKDRL